MLSTREKIAALRQLVMEKGFTALLLPNMDPHQSEYLPDHWKSRHWYSGFTGSAGVLVVTATEAAIWTDARYFLQAEIELAESGIVLHKPKGAIINGFALWLCAHLPQGSKVGCNFNLLSVVHHRFLSEQLSEKGIVLQHDTSAEDLYRDRPPLPDDPVFELTGAEQDFPRREKLFRIRQEMAQKGQYHYLITALDDVAWVLNLRGGDIPFNPVFYAFLYIGVNRVILFLSPGRIDPTLAELLERDNISIRPYDTLADWLVHFPEGETLLADSRSLNQQLYSACGADRVQLEHSIVEQLKCQKTAWEVRSLGATLAADGAALAKAFFWLETHPDRSQVTEYDFAERLMAHRRQLPGYLSESFFPIVGFRENGAIVHYRPDPAGAKKLSGEGLLLVDSGGQYLGGTTDITRTIAIGTPTEQQREHFTRVLKGHIALASVVFPKGTTGLQLDILARMHLWEVGLDFQHGTGHGVGFCLNVHEGPQGISPHLHRSKTIFEAGMLTSNEPGLYIAGEYGIRTENLILCQQVENMEGFLYFETLSLFPIDRNLIVENRLDAKEKSWLNQYHEKVGSMLGPLLDKHERQWLEEKCRFIH